MIDPHIFPSSTAADDPYMQQFCQSFVSPLVDEYTARKLFELKVLFDNGMHGAGASVYT